MSIDNTNNMRKQINIKDSDISVKDLPQKYSNGASEFNGQKLYSVYVFRNNEWKKVE